MYEKWLQLSEEHVAIWRHTCPFLCCCVKWGTCWCIPCCSVLEFHTPPRRSEWFHWKPRWLSACSAGPRMTKKQICNILYVCRAFAIKGMLLLSSNITHLHILQLKYASMIRLLFYLGGLVKLLKQMVILFAFFFVSILKYPQLFPNCINVNFHHNLLLYRQHI